MTVDQIIDDIVQREGAFADNPADKGGPTRYGVTAATLGDWRRLDRSATAAEVEALTDGEARAILKQRYVLGPGLMLLHDDRVRSLVADTFVNHGLHGGTLIVQRALRVPVDGIMGPQTIAALNAGGLGVFDLVLASRLRAYGRIIAADHSQAEFAAGWLNRCAGFLEGA